MNNFSIFAQPLQLGNAISEYINKIGVFAQGLQLESY
jgi:hypothetical protein